MKNCKEELEVSLKVLNREIKLCKKNKIEDELVNSMIMVSGYLNDLNNDLEVDEYKMIRSNVVGIFRKFGIKVWFIDMISLGYSYKFERLNEDKLEMIKKDIESLNSKYEVEIVGWNRIRVKYLQNK